jgi:exodeoxyribonuclease VII small subunit
MTKKIPKNMKFEAALAELEKQVQLLESGDLPLEDALEVFKYGTELSKICLEKLNTAKAAVEKLVVPEDDEDNYTKENFEEEETEEDASSEDDDGL